MKDDTRNRDKITLANIEKELDYQTGMISCMRCNYKAPQSDMFLIVRERLKKQQIR